MAPRPPIQAVIEEQAEFDTARRNWRMVLFNEDGTPFTGGGSLPDTTRRGIFENTNTVEFAELAVDGTALYELVLDGVVTTSGDLAVTVRPTGGDITSTSIVDRTYQETMLPTANPLVYDDNGLVVAVTGWNMACEILSTTRLMLRPDGRARAHSNFVMHPDTNQERVMYGGVASFLKVKAEIPSITVHFGGGTFTGRVSLTQIPN